MQIRLATRQSLYWIHLASHLEGEISMMDLLLLISGFGFFALSIGYAVACERL
jgi:hypothetical protein